MSELSLTVVIKGYDFLAPLIYGDVVAEGIDLRIERDTKNALDRVLADPSIPVGELSFSRQLGRLARGDHSFVGIPFFVSRAFRYRCLFVRRDSGLRQLRDLQGRRIGTNEWPATGNTWARAALREQGVAIDGIRWWVGSVDGAPSNRPQGDLPPYVQRVGDRTLREMLLQGDLDALMCPSYPKGFYEADSPIVRLIPDYRRAEMEYYRRTGIFPAHHIVGVRQEVFQHHPWVVRSLYLALEQSKAHNTESRRALPHSLPWLLSEIEETEALMGREWGPNGVEKNRSMIATLCDELLAQRLIPEPLDAASVFAEFEQVMKG